MYLIAVHYVTTRNGSSYHLKWFNENSRINEHIPLEMVPCYHLNRFLAPPEKMPSNLLLKRFPSNTLEKTRVPTERVLHTVLKNLYYSLKDSGQQSEGSLL